MKPLIIFFLLLITSRAFTQESVYDLKVNSIEEGTFDFKNFRNRVVLIVNAASGSEYVKQLDELQQLHNQYRDSGLVIIVFPTDQFGKEKRDGAQLRTFYKKYTFLVASKAKLKGDGSDKTFEWLSKKQKNGVADDEPTRDFGKYIINREGKLVAVFSPRISPLHPVIIETIRKS